MKEPQGRLFTLSDWAALLIVSIILGGAWAAFTLAVLMLT